PVPIPPASPCFRDSATPWWKLLPLFCKIPPRPECSPSQSGAHRPSANRFPPKRSLPMANKPTMTTTGGNPVADNQNSATAGPRGPVLLQDYQLIEKLAHQN